MVYSFTTVSDLNSFLADKTYLEGFSPSQADVSAYASCGGAPSEEFPHALRWFIHIDSFSYAAKKSFPGTFVAGKAPAAAAAAEEDDDDFDLFGSDDDDEEAEAANEKRLADIAAAHKAKKAAAGKLKTVVAKSSVILDVKPWSDETDLEAMEKAVRGLSMEGLVWQGSDRVDVGYGIKKIRIIAQVVDDIVSVDEDLVDPIMALDDYVQSCDIFAFNKV